MSRFRILPLITALAACGIVRAQTLQTMRPQQQSSSSSTQVYRPMISAPDAQNPYFSGVTAGAPAAGEIPLSLSSAIEQGLRNNLAALQNSQERRAAAGSQLRTRADLLPNVAARISETGEQINLAAFGFTGFPGVANVVGPFRLFDAHAYLSQPVLDFKALRNLRAGAENVKAAQFSYQDTRDLVVLVVGGLYLQAVAAASRIDAVQAQVQTAQTLYRQAVDFKNSGLVPAIEVLRAQVELQTRQQQLIATQYDFEKQKLSLAQAIGLPLTQRFRLTDKLSADEVPPVTIQQAMDHAYSERADLRSANARIRAAELSRKAAEAERLPTISLNVDYGDIGHSPVSSHGTVTATVGLNIPIYQGGRVQGKVLEADAELEQRKSERDALRNRIEYEVRATFLDLESSGRQVQVARSNVDLAQKQVAQAQDRFASGVTGNLEVVLAQDALAAANESYISSLYSYALARGVLARTVGGTERLFRQYVLGEK